MSFSIFAAAREAPDRAALITNTDSWSYRHLAERVAVAIEALRARSQITDWRSWPTPPRIALIAHPEPSAVVALLALIELGLPALLLHPRSTAEERAAAVANAAAVLTLDPADPAALLTGAYTPAAILDSPALPDDERWLAILATSGTTGAPRAVALSRRAFAFAAAASEANLGFIEHDRWLLALPFSHVGGLSVLLRCLRARRTVVLAAAGDARSPETLLETIARHRVTLLSLVPTQLHRLLAPEPPLLALPSLRAILLGGAAASPALLARANERRLPILTTYGMTETCAQVATQSPLASDRDPAGAAPPLPGIELRITDREGAIAIRSPSLLSCYLEAGRELVPLDRDGFFVTRDAGRIDEQGRLHVLGRIDDLIVSGGEKIHPLEVEGALCSVATSACVFGLPSTEWGHEVVAALSAASPLAAPDDTAIVAALSHLAPWKRPRRIAWLAELPLLPSGKPDRRATAATAAPLLRPLRSR